MTNASPSHLPLENGFNLLVQGKIVSLHPEGNNLNLQIEHPELADRVRADSTHLFVVLKNYRDLGLSMNKNTGMQIDDPKEIIDLSLVIRGAEAGHTGAVSITCRVAGAGPACYLRVRASSMLIYDEEFDAVDIHRLRQAWKPIPQS